MTPTPKPSQGPMPDFTAFRKLEESPRLKTVCVRANKIEQRWLADARQRDRVNRKRRNKIPKASGSSVKREGNCL
jgi:hypothetical protein